MDFPTAQTQYQPFAGPEGNVFTIEGLAADFTVFQPIRDSRKWEPHVIAVLERFVRPEFVCLDVGANIGAITLPMAHLASRGHVYSFEASPTAWELLKRNVAHNRLLNVTPVNNAITDRTGDTVDIFFSDQALGCAHMADREAYRAGTQETVRTLALDDYAVGRVDFIKMDVEGTEARALAGCRHLLEKNRPSMIIEYNPVPTEAYYTGGQTRRALYDMLTALYPRIAIITTPDGALEPVPDWESLNQALEAHTFRDLFCTHAKL